MTWAVCYAWWRQISQRADQQTLKNLAKEWAQFLGLNSGQERASAPRASTVAVGCWEELGRNKAKHDWGELCDVERFRLSKAGGLCFSS